MHVQCAPSSRGALAVVKANAYGLGAVQIARTLEMLDPWGFAVATIDEGIALRAADIRRPILVLRPAQRGMKEHYQRHRLRPVVESPATIAGWNMPFHLEVDTGMARTGLRWDEQQLLQQVGMARPEGVFTHLHSADASPESVLIREPVPVCLIVDAVPAAIVARGQQCRPLASATTHGSFQAGHLPFAGRPGSDLPSPRVVVALKAEIIGVRLIAKGESVSYGGDWCAERDTHIATLGIGYADGVPRSCRAAATYCSTVGAVRTPAGLRWTW